MLNLGHAETAEVRVVDPCYENGVISLVACTCTNLASEKVSCSCPEPCFHDCGVYYLLIKTP